MIKAIAGGVNAGLLAAAAALGVALTDGSVSLTDWLIIAAAAIGGGFGVGSVVYGVQNAPNPPQVTL